MRHIAFAAAITLLYPASASAAAITVFATGMVGSGIRTLGESWSAATGNTIVFVGGTVGKVEAAVTSGTPGDVVILPTSEFSAVAGRVKSGSMIAIGRIFFGLGVAKGAPQLDISTEAKLRTVLKGAKAVSCNSRQS